MHGQESWITMWIMRIEHCDFVRTFLCWYRPFCVGCMSWHIHRKIHPVDCLHAWPDRWPLYKRYILKKKIEYLRNSRTDTEYPSHAISADRKLQELHRTATCAFLRAARCAVLHDRVASLDCRRTLRRWLASCRRRSLLEKGTSLEIDLF